MRLALACLSLLAAGCGTANRGDPCEDGGCTPDAGDLVCEAGRADCNGDPSDGCEADLASPSSCGACSNVCSPPARASAVCEQNTCAFVCTEGVRCGDECLDRCGESFDAPGEHTFEVPVGCSKLSVKIWGAGGGHGGENTKGAAGGYAGGVFAVEPGEAFTVVVGSPGGDGTMGQAPGGAGGLPGGGKGGDAGDESGGGGGGLSGLFTGGVSAEDALLVAGGGGGAGGGPGSSTRIAGAGGGLEGENGHECLGGTQNSGHAPFQGAPGQNAGGGDDGGGGGGGGWFGGEGGKRADTDAKSGAGGSGYLTESVMQGVLSTGSGATPGNPEDPDRGDAALPAAPGKVVLDCVPSQ